MYIEESELGQLYANDRQSLKTDVQILPRNNNAVVKVKLWGRF